MLNKSVSNKQNDFKTYESFVICNNNDLNLVPLQTIFFIFFFFFIFSYFFFFFFFFFVWPNITQNNILILLCMAYKAFSFFILRIGNL